MDTTCWNFGYYTCHTISCMWGYICLLCGEVYGKMPEMQITVEADDETKEEASKIIRGFALP